MKIQIHPAFVWYLICITIFSSSTWQTSTAALSALLIHESAHFLLSYLFGERVSRIELTPFGGVIHYIPGHSPCKGIKGVCVAAIGPLSNYLVLLLVSVYAPAQAFLSKSLAHSIATANLSMLLLNLLPALPLDGGRIMFSLGYFLFPASRLISILTLSGKAVGAAMILLSLVGYLHYQLLNCSLLLVGGYIIVYAFRNRQQLLSENFLAIVHERMDKNTKTVCRLQLYHIPYDIRPIDLLLQIESSPRSMFIYEYAGRKQLISDQQLCKYLLQAPFKPLNRLYDEVIIEND